MEAFSFSIVNPKNTELILKHVSEMQHILTDVKCNTTEENSIIHR